jgi:hypothetical protein
MDSVLWASGGSAYHCGLRVTQDVSIVSTAAGKPKGGGTSNTKRKRPNVDTNPADRQVSNQLDRRDDHTTTTPDFLSVGYWLMEKNTSVRALAGGVRMHGIVTYDDLDQPQHYPAGAPQAEAALDVLRTYLVRRRDPEPSHDTGFEQDDHDWAGYRYGWLSDALPDFEAIEQALFAMVTAKTMGRPSPHQPFTTLYELLSGGLATTISLDNAIRVSGLYEQQINAQRAIDVKPAHTAKALAALACFTVDPYKGPDANRSLWGADNPLHTHGWPSDEVPKVAVDLKSPVRPVRSERWQMQLQGMFDPDFTTVGCLVITGRAKPSEIAAAVNRQGIEHRGVHNLPQQINLPYGRRFADVEGPMGRLSQWVHVLSKYERPSAPLPIQEFQEKSEVLDNWGWSFKTLPDAFRPPLVAVAPPVAAVPLSESINDQTRVLKHGASTPASPSNSSKPLSRRTENGYLSLVGALLEIVRGELIVLRWDKKTSKYRDLRADEKVRDADLIYTIHNRYQGLKNIKEGRIREISEEVEIFMTELAAVMSEADDKIMDVELINDESARAAWRAARAQAPDDPT